MTRYEYLYHALVRDGRGRDIRIYGTQEHGRRATRADIVQVMIIDLCRAEDIEADDVVVVRFHWTEMEEEQ